MISVTDSNGAAITDPTHIANVNPIRYRGYYYDVETGLYYLQSRYYNPQWERFINADDMGALSEDDLLSTNLFAYCGNNPVNYSDPSGYIPVSAIVGGVVGGVSGAVLGVLLANYLHLKSWKRWALISAATIGGAALGAILGPYIAKLGSKLATVAKLAIARSRNIASLIKNASRLRRTATVMKNVSTRPYINSTLTIRNIMRAAKPIADKSLRNGLKWVVRGSYNGTSGIWELVIDVTTNTIVHFLFRKG